MRIVSVLGVLLALTLVGCESSGVRTTAEVQVTVKISDYRAVALRVFSEEGHAGDADVVVYLRELTAAKLESSRLFERVLMSPEATAPLLITVKITHIQNRLFWSLSYIEKATVAADVTLTDTATSKIVGSFSAVGMGSSGMPWWWWWSGTTKQATKRMAEKIAEFVLGKAETNK